MKSKISLIIFIMIILAAWQWGEYLINIQRISSGATSLEAFIPTPSTIVKTILENFRLLSIELGYTLIRGLWGLVIGTFISLLFTFVIIFFPFIRKFVMPITQSLNSFPMVGFAPLIILVFGQGSELGIVFISALICYFPSLVILDKAVMEVNKEYVNLAEIWGAGKWNLFTKIQLPYILPFLFTSFKLSLPASIVGATLGEWLGARHGIGQMMTIALYQLKPGILYASILMVIISVNILIWIMKYLEETLTPWRTVVENKMPKTSLKYRK